MDLAEKLTKIPGAGGGEENWEKGKEGWRLVKVLEGTQVRTVKWKQWVDGERGEDPRNIFDGRCGITTEYWSRSQKDRAAWKKSAKNRQTPSGKIQTSLVENCGRWGTHSGKKGGQRGTEGHLPKETKRGDCAQSSAGGTNRIWTLNN